MRRIFLKKLKLLLLIKINKLFQVVFRFLYNKAINTFVIMFYLLKRCQEKFFKNILSLLAGKSEQICTAFPLTPFLSQKLTEFTLKNFRHKTLIQYLTQNFFAQVGV